MKSKFLNGKIYKITNDYNDHVYVGSTCDALSKNFSKHKSDSQYRKNPLYNLINEIGFERFRIELICNYPCEDKYQLRQKTSEYIRLYGKELNLQSDEKNEERKKQKEDKHHEIQMKVKENLEKRINRFRENNSIVLCECGCEIVKRGLKNHQRTQKHFDKLLLEKSISNSN